MAQSKAADIVGKIVDLLSPLSTEERDRIISASRTLLGDVDVVVPKQPEGAGANAKNETDDLLAASGKAKTWQKQNGIAAEQLGEAFHSVDGKTDVIVGEMPGSSRKEKALNAYVLSGIAQLLATGEPTFADKDARALCMSSGCYDGANHAATLKGKGNWFTGSREKGWTLTAPGLKHGATLVKGLASGAE